MHRLLLCLALATLGCGAPPSAPQAPADHAGQPHDGPAHGAHGDDATVHHRFDDVEKWAKIFDDPERAAWQKPKELVGALGIAPGSTVADIGAGTGYFNSFLAAAVGPEGRVVAVDIEQALVDHMTKRAAAEGTPQVQARVTPPDDPGLFTAEADLVLLVDTYHHIDGRTAYFTKLRGRIRPGGRLVVVDFKAGDIPVGPPPEHRIPVTTVEAELKAAGWTRTPFDDVLPHQFVAVFRPTAEVGMR